MENNMADTRADIPVTNSWVNLYASSGIAVGTAVEIFNKGVEDVRIATSASQPTDSRGFLLVQNSLTSLKIGTGENGLWAYCGSTQGTSLAIRETVALPASALTTSATADLHLATATVSIAANGMATVMIEVTGSGTGFSLTPQISQDGGTTWINVNVEADGVGAVSTPVPVITTTGNWSMSLASCDHFQLVTATGITGGSTLAGRLTASPAVKFIKSATLGAQADTSSTWYNTTASMIQLLKLLIAATVGAGSHVYTYTGGLLTQDAWTLLGTTHTKTFTYTSGTLTAESDWV